MLSQSDWRHDSRVIREAESLVRAGYEVHVLCRAVPGSPTRREEHGGVRYVSIARTPHETPRSLAQLARSHVAVMTGEARRALKGPRRRAGGAGVLHLAFFAVGAVASSALTAPPVRRLAARLPGAPASWFARTLLEPIRYLNDFARAAAKELAALDPDVVHAHDLITLSCAASVARRRGSR